MKNILNTNFEWIIIGDIHGSIVELKQLLISYGFKIRDNHLIDTIESEKYGILFLGDMIDKASLKDLKETIDFIHNICLFNMMYREDRVKMIIGNHEDMVYRWITDHPSIEKSPKRMKEKSKYYNTIDLLEKDNESKNKFLQFFSFMKPYFILENEFIATHAPCENKYLGKDDNISYNKQIKSTSRSKNVGLTNDELTPYLMKEANNNDIIHIFGHMGQESVRRYKNKICIDTGCIYGGKLTSCIIKEGKVKFKSIPSQIKNNFHSDFSSNLFEGMNNE